MDRRRLILRRFGDLSFGLGFYENGIWVDHASADADRVGHPMSEAERAALDAVHAWFDCCHDQAVAPSATAQATANEADGAIVSVASSSRA